MIRKIFKKALHLILPLFPKKIGRSILYRIFLGKKLNLSNPVDFNEKINWLIVNEYDEKYGQLADKYKVREFIIKKGLEKHLPKLYGVYDNIDSINYNSLPNSFVIKPNNGCGNVFICKNKNEFDFEKCKKSLKKALKSDFSKKLLEYHYSYIDSKIICEEYLDDGIHFQPNDYKFYCFDGKVECILVCSEREKKLRLDYYDKNWNYLNYSLEKYRNPKKIPKPSLLTEMISLAEIISENFKFVRVDLYEINNKVYFGELTFTPAAGLIYYNTEESLKYLGSLIKID